MGRGKGKVLGRVGGWGQGAGTEVTSAQPTSALLIPAPQPGVGVITASPSPHCLILGFSANKTPGAGAAGLGRGSPRVWGVGADAPSLTQDSRHSLLGSQAEPKKRCGEEGEWVRGVRAKRQG